LNHLEIPAAVFAGCSVGGYVLLELWRQAPERVRGMVFLCSKPQPDAEANLSRRAATIAQARAGGSAALFDGMAQTLIGATARQPSRDRIPVARPHDAQYTEALVAVQAGLATRPDSVPTVATIHCSSPGHCRRRRPRNNHSRDGSLHAAPGGCEFHLLADAGHFAAYEQPRKVAALLVEWLRRIEA
jgi:3-oxoadipate enol-lactonase